MMSHFAIELQGGGRAPRRLTTGQSRMYIRYHKCKNPYLIETDSE